MVETRCAQRSGSKPPYLFEATGYGVRDGLYQLTHDGHAHLQSQIEHAQQQREDQERKRKEAEQRSFLVSRTEASNRPELVEFNGRRFVRDYPKAKKLKEIYGYLCQVCGCTVATFEGIHYDNQGYAEVHHIRPLGSGHDGPDYPGNMLVLCPNHHAAFDLSTMALNPDTLEIYYLEPDGGLYKKAV
jgi:predicted restriction endonuclease